MNRERPTYFEDLTPNDHFLKPKKGRILIKSTRMVWYWHLRAAGADFLIRSAFYANDTESPPGAAQVLWVVWSCLLRAFVCGGSMSVGSVIPTIEVGLTVVEQTLHFFLKTPPPANRVRFQ